jgi:hypothetical protein
MNTDGADTTRAVVRVTDEFGNIRPYANDNRLFACCAEFSSNYLIC